MKKLIILGFLSVVSITFSGCSPESEDEVRANAYLANTNKMHSYIAGNIEVVDDALTIADSRIKDKLLDTLAWKVYETFYEKNKKGFAQKVYAWSPYEVVSYNTRNCLFLYNIVHHNHLDYEIKTIMDADTSSYSISKMIWLFYEGVYSVIEQVEKNNINKNMYDDLMQFCSDTELEKAIIAKVPDSYFLSTDSIDFGDNSKEVWLDTIYQVDSIRAKSIIARMSQVNLEYVFDRLENYDNQTYISVGRALYHMVKNGTIVLPITLVNLIKQRHLTDKAIIAKHLRRYSVKTLINVLSYGDFTLSGEDVPLITHDEYNAIIISKVVRGIAPDDFNVIIDYFNELGNDYYVEEAKKAFRKI